ncbi:DoxX family protein [Fibrella aquatilis]|uniref:DoxX family protein n=1 Tax=Fibrella aquatilis TaxID=2817059 RepID=A0A939G6Y1_9BACT|nr:DoxX family protein [Fibrella aquatilis]MBO0932338.1 DoxX family protein [Fibrella aquatilis]
MKKSFIYLLWAARLVAAIIMLQTLYFKFLGQPESIYIFTKLGVEPWGRIGSGVVELIASTLILIPRTSWIGAFVGLGVMGGAILSHLTILGIDILGDGGYLFGLAVAVAASCLVIIRLTRYEWGAIVYHLLQRLSGNKPANELPARRVM